MEKLFFFSNEMEIKYIFHLLRCVRKHPVVTDHEMQHKMHLNLLLVFRFFSRIFIIFFLLDNCNFTSKYHSAYCSIKIQTSSH